MYQHAGFHPGQLNPEYRHRCHHLDPSNLRNLQIAEDGAENQSDRCVHVRIGRFVSFNQNSLARETGLLVTAE